MGKGESKNYSSISVALILSLVSSARLDKVWNVRHTHTPSYAHLGMG
jgi:hypothetical protein